MDDLLSSLNHTRRTPTPTRHGNTADAPRHAPDFDADNASDFRDMVSGGNASDDVAQGPKGDHTDRGNGEDDETGKIGLERRTGTDHDMTGGPSDEDGLQELEASRLGSAPLGGAGPQAPVAISDQSVTDLAQNTAAVPRNVGGGDASGKGAKPDLPRETSAADPGSAGTRDNPAAITMGNVRMGAKGQEGPQFAGGPVLEKSLSSPGLVVTRSPGRTTNPHDGRDLTASNLGTHRRGPQIFGDGTRPDPFAAGRAGTAVQMQHRDDATAFGSQTPMQPRVEPASPRPVSPVHGNILGRPDAGAAIVTGREQTPPIRGQQLRPAGDAVDAARPNSVGDVLPYATAPAEPSLSGRPLREQLSRDSAQLDPRAMASFPRPEGGQGDPATIRVVAPLEIGTFSRRGPAPVIASFGVSKGADMVVQISGSAHPDQPVGSQGAAIASDGLASLPGPGPALSPTPVSIPSTAPQTGAANAIAQQVAQALSSQNHDQGGAIEVALDPPELGRLRLIISEVAGSMTVTIQADRPETAELMRRHLDLLSREFNQSGLGEPLVEFQDKGGGHGHASRDHADEDGPIGSSEGPTPPPARTGIADSGRLDIRL